ncbi:MAG TPA: DUF1207 domain-containing protein [Thermoguttaceae bacterium]|nr:DUF1207 domain-containing protein [Thermoguttaceae bacterium]
MVRTFIAGVVLLLLLAWGMDARAQQIAPWPTQGAATWPTQDMATSPPDGMATGRPVSPNIDWLTGSAAPRVDAIPQTGQVSAVEQLIQPADGLLPPADGDMEFVSEQMTSFGHVHSRAADCRQWQIAPDGLIYRSYLAGPKESRLGARWVHKADQGWIWDVSLGGRAGLVRYGTMDPIKPEGWEIDVEGAALGRLDLEAESNALEATDYRVGVPLTYGRGNHQTKLAFYHVSSHLGDELMIQQPTVPRINYVRDAIVFGHSYYLADDYRVYGEFGYSFNTDGGAEPWEFQFGLEYSPDVPSGPRPRLFWATNAHLRQEIDFGGNLTFQVGLQWRGVSGQRMRIGMQYFTGMSEQYEFFDNFEDKVGVAVWYDF